MKNKNLILATLFALTAFGMAIQSYATTRLGYTVPVNQNNVTDSYALPCTPKSIPVTGTTAGGKLAVLDEAGMVYWIMYYPAVGGDYAIFRDSATANTTSTLFMTINTSSAAAANTSTKSEMWQFNPPISVVNGLSVDLSSATDHATVCVREADGDLK